MKKLINKIKNSKQINMINILCSKIFPQIKIKIFNKINKVKILIKVLFHKIVKNYQMNLNKMQKKNKL